MRHPNPTDGPQPQQVHENAEVEPPLDSYGRTEQEAAAVVPDAVPATVDTANGGDDFSDDDQWIDDASFSEDEDDYTYDDYDVEAVEADEDQS